MRRPYWAASNDEGAAQSAVNVAFMSGPVR
jgi:hypothetical protein